MKTREQAADEWVEKYAFRVPYNGTNDFYDKEAVKHGTAGFLAGWEAAEQNRWIPVSERPDKYGEYWVYRQKANKVHKETWNGTGWAYNGNQITHWMPLPEPPKPQEL